MKSKAVAVLVGCSLYDTPTGDAQKLADLPQVDHNLERLRVFLLKKGLNDLEFTEEQIVTVPNPKTVAEVGNAVLRATNLRPEFLLFYYSGHGLRLNGKFQMALSSSTTEGPDFATYPEDSLRNQLKRHPAIKRKLVIFDCCYAGAGLPGAMNETARDNALPISKQYFEGRPLEGTAFLAACDARSLTFAVNTQKHTTFSGELLSVLERGVEPDRRAMSIGEVFDATRKRVVERIEALPDAEKPYYGEPISAYFGDISDFPLLAYRGPPQDTSSTAVFRVIGKLIDRRGGRFEVSAATQTGLTQQISKLIKSKDDPGLRLALDVATLDRVFEEAQLGVTLVEIRAPKDRVADLARDVHPIYANPRSYQIHLGYEPDPPDAKLLEQSLYLPWITHRDEFIKDQARVLSILASGRRAEPAVPMCFNAPGGTGIRVAEELHPDERYHGKMFYPLTLAFQKIASDEQADRYLLLVGLLGAGRIAAFGKPTP